MTEWQFAVGRNKIEFKDEEEDPYEVKQPKHIVKNTEPKLVQNFDVTKFVVGSQVNGQGHTNYMYANSILEICLNIDLK
jgi:hypothetical protein